MPKQLTLKPEPAPIRSSLIVQRSKIPSDLTATEKLTLREHFDHVAGGESYFFWDCAAVRRVLRMESNA